MVPLGVASLVVGLVMVRNVGEVVRDRLDVPSVLLSAVGFGSTVLGLSTLGEAAGQPDALAQALVALAVGVVTLGVFTRRQLVLQRSGAPLLDLRPFLEARFTFSLLTMLLAMFAMFGSMIVLPIYLQNVHGYGTLVAGLVMLPGGLAMAVMSQVVGRLYDAFGSRWLVLPGALGLTSAAWTMTLYTPQTALWMIVVTQTALMVSLGLLFTPLFSDALGALEQRLTSHGSAILNTLQQLAGAAGTALAVTALSLGAGWSGAADQVTSLMAGARAAYLAGAVVSLGVVVAVMLQRRAVARAGV